MYHIKKDKRSLRSAQLIYQGLLDCLDEKEFQQISISDIQRKSFISRSTFYRLFDTLNDVLDYQIYLVFQDTISKELTSSKERNIFFIQTWIQHHILLETVIKADLTYLLYQGHQAYLHETILHFDNNRYLSRLLSSIMISTLIAWIENGRKETAPQLYEKMATGLNDIQDLLEDHLLL